MNGAIMETEKQINALEKESQLHTPNLSLKDQRALRYWFEEWKPKHSRECDCKGCDRPLISLMRIEFLAKERSNKTRPITGERVYDGISIDDFDGLSSRTHAHKCIKLLERHGLIHNCYAMKTYTGQLKKYYRLGSAKKCTMPEYHSA